MEDQKNQNLFHCVAAVTLSQTKFSIGAFSVDWIERLITVVSQVTRSSCTHPSTWNHSIQLHTSLDVSQSPGERNDSLRKVVTAGPRALYDSVDGYAWEDQLAGSNSFPTGWRARLVMQSFCCPHVCKVPKKHLGQPLVITSSMLACQTRIWDM